MPDIIWKSLHFGEVGNQFRKWHTTPRFRPKIVYSKDMENKANDSMISLLQNPKFIDAIQGMSSFCYEMNPDIDMAYDYVCEQANVSTFVADGPAWDLFYDMWEVVQSENS